VPAAPSTPAEPEEKRPPSDDPYLEAVRAELRQ
jgi:hypothetical protein